MAGALRPLADDAEPSFYVRNVGTCGLTLVDGGDWFEHFFPIAPTSVVFGVGAARAEPVVRGDAVVVGRVLKCTLMADNYVIPGLLGSGARTGLQGIAGGRLVCPRGG